MREALLDERYIFIRMNFFGFSSVVMVISAFFMYAMSAVHDVRLLEDKTRLWFDSLSVINNFYDIRCARWKCYSRGVILALFT